MKKKNEIIVPEAAKEVLLHACCAPCSTAIVEWMLAHEVHPTIFYYNPNIYPLSEYLIRKEESKRHAESLGLKFIDGDYHHEAWREAVSGLEDQPERGSRCLQCFKERLLATAICAKETGLRVFTTTLASSRWKSLEQVNEAGNEAQQRVEGTLYWPQNWRIGGLSERRAALIREYDFYQQRYCGCEFSMNAQHLPKDYSAENISLENNNHKDSCQK